MILRTCLAIIAKAGSIFVLLGKVDKKWAKKDGTTANIDNMYKNGVCKMAQ